MDDKTKARFKDEILRYLDGWEKPVTTESICLNTLGRHYEYGDANNLCSEIISYDDSLLIATNEYDAMLYNITPKAIEFLNNGGFVKLHDKEVFWNRIWKGVRNYIPLGISALSLIIAILSYNRPSDNVLQEQFDTKIQQIEYNQKQLELQYREENQKQQDQLDKANEWIDMLESEEASKALRKASL